MATLYIRQYREKATDARGNPLEAGKEPALADQALSFDASAASNAFENDCHFVLLKATADAHLVFGKAPTATASNWPLEANVAMFFGVQPGQSLKVAAYDGTS